MNTTLLTTTKGNELFEVEKYEKLIKEYQEYKRDNFASSKHDSFFVQRDQLNSLISCT